MVESNKNFQGDHNSNYSAIADLGDFETGLRKYNEVTAKLISNEINSKEEIKILDFGAGKGTLTQLISKDLGVPIDCLELDLHLQQELLRKNFRLRSETENLVNHYDYILSSNVLEHVRNDELEISKLRSYLKHGGKIILYLPANQVLFSDFDSRVGHYRRYNKSNLESLLKTLGFKIEKSHYVDSIGFLAALLFKFKTALTRKSNISMPALIAYDRIVFPASILLDRLGAKYLVGKNIFVVAKKL
jgi:SAM-dependent methyltransferase